MKRFILFVFFFLPFIVFSQNWTQIGADIDGESANDHSGRSVSISGDGNIVAIGAPDNYGQLPHCGQVRVYQNINGTWVQLGQDIDGEASDDDNGWCVSLSNDGYTIAIGAPHNDGNVIYSQIGHVRVYNWNGASWNQLGNDIDGEAANDYSGADISISSDGHTLAIGAQYNDGNGTNSGHVRVYNWDGSSWNQVGQDIDGEGGSDGSGRSVSLSSDGNIVAIGANYNDGNGNASGHVRIYSYNGSSWIQLGQDIDGEATNDNSGWSVSISSVGNTVAIGAYGNSGNGTDAGHVRVYENINGTWVQIGQDIDGEAASDHSGWAVSLSSDGTIVAIGATTPNGGSGYVRIYSFDGTSWNQLGSDIDGESVGDHSGYSVSLSSDGSTVAIGAKDNDGNGSYAGHVRVYQFPVPGCMDSTALNYDPNATTDDGSCTYCINDTSYTNITACDSIVWNGNIYTQSGIYSHSEASSNNYSMSFSESECLNININPISSSYFSCNVWMRSDYQDNGYMIMHGDDGWLDDYGFAFQLSNGYIELNVNATNLGNSTTYVTDGAWHFISFTFNNGISKLYIDGNLEISDSSIISLDNSPWPLMIGSKTSSICSSDDGSGSVFNGEVDDLHLWNVALSHQEIQQYMQCPPTGLELGLMGYWNFEEGSGNTVFDLSANSNNGTNNGATYDSNVPIQSCNLINVNGCDSVAVLELTINQADTSYTNITACDSMVWNGITYDSSGTYITTTLSNNYSLDFGPDAFNGNPIPPHNHVEIVNNINPTQEITIMGWVKIDGFDINDQRTFVMKCDINDNKFWLLGAQWNKLGFYIHSDGTSYGDWDWSQTDLGVGWRHVAGTYDGSVMKIYIDGQLDPMQISVNGGITSSVASTYFGDPIGGGGGVGGHMDNFSIWDIALSQQEIQDYMNCSPQGNESGLISYWNMEDYVGNVISDLANNNNGNIFNNGIDADILFSSDVPIQGCVQQLTNINGCDSVAVLELTINQADTSYTSVTVCDSLFWNGITYDSSGTYYSNVGSNNNYSLDFGLNDVVHIQPVFSGLQNNFSIGAWVLPESFNGWGSIFLSRSNDHYLNIESATYSANAGSVQVRFGLNISGSQQIFGDLNVNQWNYVVGTYDGATQKLFVNGVLVDSQSSNIGNAFWNETCWTSIGGDGSSAPGCSGGYTSIEGKLDNVQLWDFALTEQDINQYMCASLIGNETGLVGYWDFDEGSGNTAFDLTSNGNNGAITGAIYDGDVPSQSCNLININGCDSVAVLELTINQADTSYTNITTCDSLVWNGTTYTQSGTYYYIGGNGDSIMGFNYSGYYNGSYYYLSNSTDNWMNADSICNANGGHLLTISDSLENSFVVTLIDGGNLIINNNNMPNGMIWLGMSDVANEGVWEWSNGEPLNYTNWETWPGGSSPNGGVNENYGAMNGGGTFDDRSNNGGPFYYILEIPRLINANGCDSVAVLDLTINKSDTSYTNISVCDNVFWNGVNYDSSGTYYYNGAANNYSLDFSGINNYVEVPDHPNYDFGLNQDFTVSTWFKTDESYFGLHALVAHDGVDGTILPGWQLGFTHDYGGSVMFTIHNQTGSQLFYLYAGQGGILFDNMWHNIAIVIDQGVNGSMTLYVDGVVEDIWSGNLSIDVSNTANLLIGTDRNYANSVNDHIDNTSIWSKSLSQQEIQQYMSCPPTGNELGLVGYWNFEEGSGNTAFDLTSYGNNGTINGATYDSNVHLQSCNLTNINGCDSVALLDLTINQADTSYTSVTACDSYEWNGFTYDSSGTYYYHPNLINNYSMSFDGDDDISNFNSNNLNLTGDMSMCFNILVSEIVNSSTHIITFGGGGESNSENVLYTAEFPPNSSEIYYNHEYGSGINIDVASNFILDTNQWYNVIMTRDTQSQEIKIFIDGNETSSFIYSDNPNGGQAGYFSLADDFGEGNFKGNLDDIFIWDKKLTPQEIQEYMSCPPTGAEAGLVGYWDFEEGSGNTVFDLTTNGNDGAINGATYDSNVPLQVCNLANVSGCDSILILELTIDISGCTDSTAINYNPLAACNDSSCIAALLPCSDLFISEYVEGLGPNNALEIYNSTNNIINLSDYQLERYRNGDTNSLLGGVTQLTGSLMPGDVWVITNGDTVDVGYGSISPILYNLGDQAPPDGSYPTPLHMNGDDAIVLSKISTGEIIDVFGRIGEDPGLGWTADSTANFTDANGALVWSRNHTLIRKSDVLQADNYGENLFDPSLQWDSLSIDTWNNLGFHHCDCPIYGCLDSLSLNYNVNANIDDGSCIAVINGCTDSVAINYNIIANTDDGSCIYCINDTSYTTIISCDSLVWNGTTYTQSGIYYYDSLSPNNNFSLEFDMYDDYIEWNQDIIPSGNHPNEKTTTVMAWSYVPYQIPTGGQGGSPNNGGYGNGYRNIFSQGDASNAWFLGYEDDGQMRLSHQWYDIPVQYPFGEWVHFAVVCDQNNGYTKLYKNGVLAAQTSSTMMPSHNAVFRIGRQWSGNTHSHEDWFGMIDDVQVWRTIFTASDIQHYMNCPPVGDEIGLIGYWDFEAGSGYTAYDQTPNGNHGLIHAASYDLAIPLQSCGNLTNNNGCDSVAVLDLTINQADTSYTSVTACDNYGWNDSIYTQSGTYFYNGETNNYSMSFDGNNQYIDVQHNSILPFDTTDFSISFDIKASTQIGGPNNNEGGIINKYYLTDQRGFYIRIQGTELKYSFSDAPSNNWNGTDISSYLNNQWFNIAFTCVWGDVIKVYVDGSLVDSLSMTNVMFSIANSEPLGIGRGYNYGNYSNLNLDNIQIWSAELSQYDIQEYMNCPPTGSEAGLVGYWNFEEGSGNTVFDLTTNSNDGTNNGATYDSNIPLQSCNLINVNGCDSVAVLDLTINQADTSYTSVTACDSVVWNGVNYDSSGTYYSNVSSNNNYSMSFDGVDDYITLGANILSSYPFTIMADIYIDSLAINNIILTQDNSWCLYIRNPGNGPMQLEMWNEFGGWARFDYLFNENEWYNISFSVDVNNNVSSRVNSVAIPLIINSMNQLTLNHPGDIHVGYWALDNESFNGKIDNIQIWDSVLTGNNIQQYMQCSPTGSELGLMGYWNFEEGSGNTVFDLTTNSNDGTNNGATYDGNVPLQSCNLININGCDSVAVLDLTINQTDTSYTNITACDSVVWNGITYDSSGTYYSNVSSNNNYSMSFDGDDGYVDFGDVLNNLSFPVTFSWDIKMDSTGNEFSLFCTDSEMGDVDDNGYGIWATVYPDHISFAYGDGLGAGNNYRRACDANNLSLLPDIWYNITGVINGPQDFKIYLDGNLLPSVYSGNGGALFQNNYSFTLGGAGIEEDDVKYYRGSVDNLHIWNIELSQYEIQQYMNCQPNGDEFGLVGYWDFEEGSGNTVFDLTANGNDGTINGATYDSNAPLQSCDLTNINGCDSVAVLDLTIINSSVSSSLVTSCDSYTWNGTVYTTSGVYTNIYTNSIGCDSIHTMNLTINYSNLGSSSVTTCDSYNWDSITYTSSGTYTNTYTNVGGCDSIHTLNLIINHSDTSYTSVTACDSVVWNGVTYDSSGTYYYNGGLENNYSMYFDGINDYIELGDLNNTFNSYSDFSFIGYFKTDGSYSSSQALIFSTADNNYNNASIWLGIQNNQILLQYFDGSTHSNYLHYGNSCSDNQWHSLALSLDNQGDLFIYLDGIQVGHETSVQVDFNFANYFSFGHDWDPGGPSDFFVGNLDNISVWDRFLTYQEIQQYISCSPIGNEIGLVSFWDFEEGYGSVIYGTGTNGSIYGSASFESNVPSQSCNLMNINDCDSTAILDLTIGLSGCTDPAACNYDALATCDNGSCLTAYGCMDVTACNYDALATCDDGSCLTDYGCMDPNAFNYDPVATCPDGSCIAVVSGCTDSAACNYDPAANTDDGSCLTDYGCTDPTATNYDANATCDDGNCTYCIYGCADITACNYDINATCDDGSCLIDYGCTDPTACNYDALATCDDGSCLTAYGCTDPSATNYDANATCDDGSCVYCVYGCMDITACNYDISATCDDGACILPDGCTDPIASNYNPIALCDDGSCIACIYGCIDITQVNYDPFATCDDGSCIPYSFGCMDPLAVNYNPMATASDGSCLYLGCTDSIACNYDINADLDDGSCNLPDGCTDSTAFNFDPSALCDDGSCIAVVYGCTDLSANNYDILANTDDGSCEYTGCTDPLADNYNPIATVDDGSCTYPVNCGADVTGMFVSDIIDDRVVLNWDNMNTYDANGDQICRLDKLRIKYRPLGTNTWLWAAMGDPSGYDANGFCNSTQVTSKARYMLQMNTTYEWWMRAWYCSGEVSSWVEGPQFTTAPQCPVVGNLSVVPFTNPNNGISKATFSWDDSNGPYVFCRIKMRVDSISNPVAADWLNVGGGSVPYGTFTATKYGLTPGESYRAQAKGHCDPTGHPAYNSLTWTPLIFWTQPSLRVDGASAITNLDVYPNPSRDVFNISFTSESVQDLRVRVLNVVGEEIVLEEKQQFVGEYVKSINLNKRSKGIYFLEIETDGGIINKKLILQ